jgi:rubrerythrin
MKKGVTMDVLNFACKIEQESIDFYKDLSRKESAGSISGIMLFLSAEEIRHLEIIKSWQAHSQAPQIIDAEIAMPDPAKVFKQLADYYQKDGIPARDYYDLYERAFLFERKTLRFYAALAKRYTDERSTILRKIMAQEKSHAFFFKNMLEIIKRPGEWLENAEIYHLDEY